MFDQGQIVIAASVSLLLLALTRRRDHLRQFSQSHRELNRARQHGTAQARLLHPSIDLRVCIGCGACTRVCPEDDVIALRHGQAMVVHGSRCIGHGECAAACPAGAISLTLGDISQRRDLPAVDEHLETMGVPGLYVAGELSGYALVRTAVSHGIAVANRVAANVESSGNGTNGDIFDLLIVGAGPAGLACSLRAKELGLRFATIEQETRVGGTIAAYPRRKLVMTQPLALPLYGRLSRTTYTKEELMHVWDQAVQQNHLPLRTGVRLTDVSRTDDGLFVISTTTGEYRARHVCLAMGRRGTPNKLGVPGEDLVKVSYSLLDAASYTGRKILIVGGGDSAIESAMALAQQPGNQVTVSYRRNRFTRLKTRNEKRLIRAMTDGSIRVMFESQVDSIQPETVQVRLSTGQITTLPNDEVFIMAGGEPPFAMLERAGVSFDQSLRPVVGTEQPRDWWMIFALLTAGVSLVGVILWADWFWSYYRVPAEARATLSWHPVLRPSSSLGLTTGIAACVMFVANMTYLLKRSTFLSRFLPGRQGIWMTWHVLTGILAVLLIVVHCGFAIRPTVGGHALIALAVVILTGSVGRYMYAQFPRAANGREASLEELRAQLSSLSGQWEREGMAFGAQVRQELEDLVIDGRWRSSFFARLWLLLTGPVGLRSRIKRLRIVGESEGIPHEQMEHVFDMARRAQWLTLLVTHYEEMGAVVSLWRYFHRWVAILMLTLTVIHIVTATRYVEIAPDFFHSLQHLFR